MTLTLYAHPFSSYCWKVLIALYENATPFRYRRVEDEAGWAELASMWPIRKFPLLRDDEAVIVESSIIIEYLMHHHPGPVRLIPEHEDAALQVPFMDRFFHNYVITPMQAMVGDRRRPAGEHGAGGHADAGQTLEVAYGWLEGRLQPEAWAVGRHFSLADCAAAPALFYADWVHPISDRFATLSAYRRRLLTRPSVARVVEEARPFRTLFPGGAPERD